MPSRLPSALLCRRIPATQLMNTMVTEVSKRAVGRWRPNALARCQPQPADGTVVIGAPASANPACTAPASHKLTDAHYRC